MLLTECLQRTPRRTLLAISRANSFACASRATKAELEAVLAQQLARRYRSASAAQLPAHLMEALHALARHRGQMPLVQFEQRFGPIRPYRPWRSGEVRNPWHAPLSAAEDLYFRGLVYVARPLPGAPAQAILPEEFGVLAPSLRPGPTVGSGDSSAGDSAGPAVVLDIALLLAYLQQVDLRPVRGRWMSMQHCRSLAACLAPPLAVDELRSERQVVRLAFAHYLAERSDLLTLAGGLLKPSPAADGWLALGWTALINGLWRAWLAPSDDNRDLWRRYRLPGHGLRDPAGFARRLVDMLADHGPWSDAGADQAELAALLPWWEQEKDQATVQTLVFDLLAGPLSWLGAVSAHGDVVAAAPSWQLTPLGAWLLGRRPDPPAPVEQGALQASDDLNLALPAGAQCPLPAVLALAGWCDLASGPRLRVTQASLARALARGNDLSGLFAIWQRFATPPLHEDQRALIAAWASSVRLLELRPALLLHGPSAEAMTLLWSDRAIRSQLGSRLAGDLATVRTGEPARLVNALQSRGFALRSPQPVEAEQSVPLASHFSGDAWWLYAAGLIHRRLAARLGMAAPPGATLAVLRAILGPAQQAVAEATAEAIMAALEEAVEGPASATDALGLEEVERRLLAALEAGETVRLVYWSPWYAQRSVRCVKPLRIEWRGDHRYLAAHCLTANDERTFRLDRILGLTQCETA